MVTLITSPATATNLNSYVSLSEADTYISNRLHYDNWSTATDENKEKALLQATHILDYSYRWKGYKRDYEQPLQFPRYNVLEEDGWYLIPDDEIPQEVKDATIELAYELIAGDRIREADEPSSKGIQSITIPGAISITYNKADEEPAIPDRIYRIVEWLVEEQLANQNASFKIMELERV